MSEALATKQISEEAMTLLGTAHQVQPFSRRYPDFDLAAAYEVVARVRDLRRARGEKPIGRKIGFTNRSIWTGYGISGPIWNYVFDRTVSDAATQQASIGLIGMPEARIEPEVVLHLAATPGPDMATAELIECLDWVAPGFEVVYSIFPNWEFTAAEALATRLGISKELGNIADVDLDNASETLTQLTFRPTETEGLAKAEVTAGGINTAGLSSKTMEARQVPGLYAIGEAVEVTGWLGGYNLQWAWSSGFVAGHAIAARIG